MTSYVTKTQLKKAQTVHKKAAKYFIMSYFTWLAQKVFNFQHFLKISNFWLIQDGGHIGHIDQRQNLSEIFKEAKTQGRGSINPLPPPLRTTVGVDFDCTSEG